MFDRLEFLFGEATMALRRNVLMALAAITTVAVSLFLIGGLGYVYFRIDEYARTLPGKQEMRVFLRSGAPYAQITETAKQIRAMPGVASAVWMPKEKVWEKERLQHPDLTEG
ncbi:MAG: hypothetical protein HY248_06505, partial [Fimbriimonas ginsengisoli]|nr:hypothetical protein [Fimbriimonas ginsengisoli]